MPDNTDAKTEAESIEHLRESEARFRSLVDSAPDAIILGDSEGRIILWNQGARRLFGYGDEILGQPIAKLMPERYRAMHEAGMVRWREKNEMHLIGRRTELHGLRKDGTEFPLELSLAAWKVGDRMYCSGIVRDLTRRQTIEAALEQKTTLANSLQRLTAASNEAQSIEEIMQLAVKEICGAFNWRIGQVFMISDEPEKLVGSGIWYIRGPATPELQDFIAHSQSLKYEVDAHLPIQVKEAEKPLWVEASQVSPDRMEKMQKTTLATGFTFPLLLKGMTVAVLEFFSEQKRTQESDFTQTMVMIGAQLAHVVERKLAEKQLRNAESHYRQLVESLQAVVWRADVSRWQFRFVSKEAEALLGFPLQNWVDQPNFWAERMHPDDLKWVVDFSSNAIADKRQHVIEYRMKSADDRIVWVRDSVRVITENQTTKELIGVMLDVTEQKRADDVVRKSREQLRALAAHLQFVREEERSKIAREIHDELGQILTACKMDLGLMKNIMAEPGRSKRKQEILKEVDSLSGLLDQAIKSVRKIVTELRPETLDHLGLSAAIEWQAQEYQTRTGIQVNFLSDIDTSDLSRDLATAVFRIFQETLTNVARHANASQVRIHLRRDDGYITLEVQDNGRGITEKDMARSKSFGILGMKERASLLQGEIKISGTEGQGTQVLLRVPLTAPRQ